MFTGIVSHRGIFRGYRQGKTVMAVEAPDLSSLLKTGDSLAVNGVCLTLIEKEKGFLFFNLSQETMLKTNLGSLRPGEKLNCEPPLTLASLVSGHLVSGHVDSTAKVLRTARKGAGKRLTVSYSPDMRPFLIPKGSVAVNGVSLTIASLKPGSFEVELIPLTLRDTNLGALGPGDTVNLECDIIGKYVYNWISKERR
jgi:riboflavin synthase